MGRVFFALVPGAHAAALLAEVGAELAARAGGKPVPAAKIHLTLAFLGSLEPDRLDAASAIEVAAPAMRLAMDCVGSFRAARVAWAGMSQTPAALSDLQSRLSRELRARGFALEDRPFAPHVTLARRIERAIPRSPIEPIEWEAGEVALMLSQPGSGRYSTLETWTLGKSGG
jgi:RNA 2',3'-cyclic 3'-phosphodiesterase